ncbi:hypothetical protein PNP85_10115 [Halobacterium salinarum]|uniref:hypothetical protein n=1 Tax=Halobacterium TaxID=2239 RepID=UPI002552C2C2|nr:hypothetical protein [Halobacterium salinarum]MDL0128179.1 hypothetical protein [Halobacterium salinarum]MDL0139857.1 hypothetical protein [Halobacterium salinarum]
MGDESLEPVRRLARHYADMAVSADPHTDSAEGNDLEPILADDEIPDLECRGHGIDAPVLCWPCYRDPHWFRTHQREFPRLLDPSYRWRWSEVAVGKPILEQAKRRDVVHPVDGGKRLWRTDAAAWDMLQQVTSEHSPEKNHQATMDIYR